MGLPWDGAADIWSTGCIVAELFLGDLLFDTPGEDDAEHLALIHRACGPFPRHMLREVARRNGPAAPICNTLFGTSGTACHLDTLPAASRDRAHRQRTLADAVGQEGREAGLADLLDGLLAPDVQKRSTAGAASRHSFFRKG